MAYEGLSCPACGAVVRSYRNPVPTVDVIIETEKGIVLIERKNEPYGWAIPGGFVDYGEKLEEAARREAREETGLDIGNLKLLGCYSDPQRDKRQHNISTVYVATAKGEPVAGDDAAAVRVFPVHDIPENLCFDHGEIIADYIAWKSAGGR